MSAKTFFIAHGEKIAVAVVAGGCGFALWGTFSDASIQPRDNAQRVEEINRRIEEVFKTQSPPVMKEPRPYLDQLIGRVGEQLPVTPTMAWLSAPPDMSKDIQGDKPFVYVYEVLAPSVQVKDAVGQLQVGLTLPQTVDEGPGRRVSNSPDRSWTRSDKGEIVNRARHVAIQVQVKVGAGDWRPLALPGASKDGVLALESIPAEPVAMPAIEPWQKHSVRARIVTVATAYDFATKEKRPRETVVVMPGRVSKGPTDDERVIFELTNQVLKRAGPLVDNALRPVDGPLPASVKLDKAERVFLGPWSDLDGSASADITGNVRCALTGFTVEPLKEDPSKTREVAKFLLLRLFQQGAEQKWLEKPIERKYGVGDVLGEKDVAVPNPFPPGKNIPADFSTPFAIQSLVKDQKRVLYWTIKPKPRQGGGKGRDLFLDKKEVPTDIVVLKNPDTGSELVLTKLINVSPPAQSGLVVYPFRAAAQNERDDFVKAPSEFKQWGLVPEEPKAHQPKTGPLLQLHKQKVIEGALDAGTYDTDTAYYELADGRLVWWEPVNLQLQVHDPNHIEKPAEKSAAPVEAAPTMPPGEIPGGGKMPGGIPKGAPMPPPMPMPPTPVPAPTPKR